MSAKLGMRRRERTSLAVQVVILALSAWLGLEAWLDHRESVAVQAFATYASVRITDLASRSNPELHARASLLPLLRGTSGPGLTSERLHSIALYRGLAASFYRYDAEGRRIDLFPAGAPNVWLMDRLARGLISRDRNQIEESRRLVDKKLPFLIGEGRDLTWLRNERGRLIEVFSANGAGYLAWNADKTGIRILHCPTIPSESDIFERLIPPDRRRDILLAGFARTGDTDMWQRGRLLDPLASRAFQSISASHAMNGTYAGFWWEFLETIDGRIVYGAFEPPVPPEEFWRFALRTIGCVILAVSLYFLTRSGRAAAIRLRFLLVLLFLASASIPLFSIMLGSIDVVSRYQEILGTRVKAAQDEAIRNLVQEFDGYLASCTAAMRPCLQRAADAVEPSEYAAILRDLEREHLADWLQIRDAAGQLLYSSVPTGPADRETLLMSMARRAVERYQPGRLGEKPYKGNSFTDSIVRRDDMGFSTLINAHRQIQMVQSGANRLLYYLATLSRGRGEAAYFETRLALSRAVKNYLRRKAVQRQEFDGGWIRFYALDMQTSRWPLPPPRVLADGLSKMAMASWVTGQPRTMRLSTARHGGFAVCIPCPKLADHCLIAYYADDRHIDRIRRLWRDILVTGAAFLAMIMLLGVGIARQLLRPLHHIEDAVQALSLRNFDKRLDVAGNDEMARLFQTFNLMMAESRELHVARTVQEGLVPSRFPTIPGYSIAGKVFTASDLSGDCLDGFSLPDGRFAFLVGDITGHGVAAALLMAFSRAVTYHWSQGERLTPSDFADTLDRLLKRQREARRFMSAICGILDPRSHEVEYVVGGHPYPVFIDQKGNPKMIGSPSLPLGRGKKPIVRTVHRIALEPGTRLLIATDGFIEALDAKQHPIGFDRLQEWAASTPADTADNWISRLMTQLDSISPPPRADDTTLFAIVRDPVPKEDSIENK
ncbi:MAG TPA: SpoIIE family protein phosphatase [Candidatus Ozemobacteraceae bacterium]|nr:SpoIIE family protein phosphatase [Candidatus Ozemobacteraceae bacterium]